MDNDRPMFSYFQTGFKNYILFEQLYTLSPGATVGACFAIFALGMLYEGIKSFRLQMEQNSGKSRSSSDVNVNGSYDNGFGFMPGMSNSFRQFSSESSKGCSPKNCLNCVHLVQTTLHILQTVISYFLMLVVMTFNVWLCLAVVLSAGVGYCVFGWRRAVPTDTTDHSP